MLSLGICCALASAIALRSRKLPLGSPPPMRAAVTSSRMRRVNTLPRAASVAPFLRLIVAHFEWPLIVPREGSCSRPLLRLARRRALPAERPAQARCLGNDWIDARRQLRVVALWRFRAQN